MFQNRSDAGRRLAEELRLRLTGDESAVILGLPRGGVPVASEVASALHLPLDVIVVRKLGVPYQPELAMGAIGEDGVRVVDGEVARLAGVSDAELSTVERRERAVLEDRVSRFRVARARLPLTGRTAVVVDDGIATGSTARAACAVARAHGASRVVLAVPVAPSISVADLSRVADEVVCLEPLEPFFAVGQCYEDFRPTSDEEVLALLRRAATAERAQPVRAGAAEDPPGRDEEVEIDIGGLLLPGRLTVPSQSRGLVVFAHGSGSSRHSPRNRFVAAVLNEAGLGTLLTDLLSPAEELDRFRVFDIELLAARLQAITRWLGQQPEADGAAIGYFGASTGGGAALWAAAGTDSQIGAVVSRGGRPDLALPVLERVTAPTLLIVGGDDDVVLDLNRQAMAHLRCPHQLAVVPGATHLFEEPGALEAVAGLAADWFTRYLAPPRSA